MDIEQITKQVRRLDIVTKKQVTELFAGNYKSSFHGQGVEVESLREYEDGDDVRFIDWVATAKYDHPLIRRYRETRELTTFLMIDVSASMNFTSVGKQKSDVAIETAAMLLHAALKNNDRFGVVLFSDVIEKYIPPRKGKTHLMTILREIIIAYENNVRKKSDVSVPLEFINTIAHKHPICFFITDDLPSNKKVTKQLRVANRRNDLVFLHVEDPLERGEFTYTAPLRMEDPETGEAVVIDLSSRSLRERFTQRRKEKMMALQSVLRKNRIDTVTLDTHRDVYPKLFSFFKMRQMQR